MRGKSDEVTKTPRKKRSTQGRRITERHSPWKEDARQKQARELLQNKKRKTLSVSTRQITSREKKRKLEDYTDEELRVLLGSALQENFRSLKTFL
jgi:hypothetical protein